MSPLPKRIAELAREALDPEVTRLPAAGFVEALAHKGTGIITLVQNNPGLTEEALRDAFARTARLLNALEDELVKATPDKKTGKKPTSAATDSYKGFSPANLEPFIDQNACGKIPEATGAVDGACKGNPGPAGIGAVLYAPDGSQCARISKAIGKQTNNIAEYTAFITLLETALALRVRRLRIQSDSELMVKQVNGQYKVKNENILPLMRQVVQLLRQFETVCLVHVPREENTLADALSTRCLE